MEAEKLSLEKKILSQETIIQINPTCLELTAAIRLWSPVVYSQETD